MPLLPSEEELKSMMYRDLQKICKDWGVRANLKSDEMISLLLETQLNSIPAIVNAPALQQRSVPARRSSRSGSTRTSSSTAPKATCETMGQRAMQVNASVTDMGFLGTEAPESSIRTKKARNQQRRLGVGRPTSLGGVGPRAITRSHTLSQEKRLRSGRSIKELGAVIQQGQDDSCVPPPFVEHLHRATGPAIPEEPSQEISVHSRSRNARSITQDAGQQLADAKIPDYHQLLLDIVKPLQDQIDTLKAEVTRLQSLEPRFNALNSRMVQMRTGEMGSTEAQPPHLPNNPSTPATTSNIQIPQTLLPSPHIITSSPVQHGKRARVSPIKAATAAEDESEQERTPSPIKKRLKSSEGISNSKGKEVTREESPGSEAFSSTDTRGTSVLVPRSTSFIVYNDLDDDLQPPGDLLPDHFMSRSDGPSTGRPTSSSNASENQYPFNFSFVPEPSTPVPSLFMPAFPYPEPPQSPTPVGTNIVGSLGNVEERTDVFKPFGLPPPDRAGRLPNPSSDRTVNPSVLSRRDPPVKDRQSSSNEVAASLGLIPPSPREPESNSGRDVPASGKTMYGTELGADSRFGDFGLESVAARFWSSGRI